MSTRQELRQLPPERRRDVRRAIVEGRAVKDPRDAALAAAIAARAATKAGQWPLRTWIRPRTARARIMRAVHIVALAAALSGAALRVWRVASWGKWVVVAYIAWLLVAAPTFVLLYRGFANAAAALEANRRIETR